MKQSTVKSKILQIVSAKSGQDRVALISALSPQPLRQVVPIAMALWLLAGVTSSVCFSAELSLQFEVASIRPIDVDNRIDQINFDTMFEFGMGVPTKAGKVAIGGWTLRQLIARAYGVPSNRVTGSGDMDSQRFEVKAVIPAHTPSKQLNMMLQALLVERFALKARLERQPRNGYIMTVAKGGLRLKPPIPSDPSAPRSEADTIARMSQEKPPPVGGSHTEMPSATSAGIAEMFARDLKTPVSDQTGLTGRYHIVLEIPPPADEYDRDPRARILNAAKTLGLDLKSGKVEVDVVVVESVSKMPTPN